MKWKVRGVGLGIGAAFQGNGSISEADYPVAGDRKPREDGPLLNNGDEWLKFFNLHLTVLDSQSAA
jgi:hypothetical protein